MPKLRSSALEFHPSTNERGIWFVLPNGNVVGANVATLGGALTRENLSARIATFQSLLTSAGVGITISLPPSGGLFGDPGPAITVE